MSEDEEVRRVLVKKEVMVKRLVRATDEASNGDGEGTG